MEETQICEMQVLDGAGGTDSGLVGVSPMHQPELIDAASTANIRYAVWPVTADRDWCGKYEERPMASKELLARVAMIEKLETERKAKAKTA
jgi:hypothetical protein